MDTELLAPAGDKEAAYSAFYFGADAVYLGLKSFSARAEAVNFSESDLDEITAFAHSKGKKVYVAINTLMQESELPELLKMLSLCEKYQVDAVIVQDLGVARIVKKCFPSLVLHASTQMAVHNLAGALALKKQGFERVVLARELSLKEIIEIKEKSGVEIEVFIHGALCYSYSGLCLFSSLTTSRSANRGKCVYSCRSLFERNGKKSHLFSMKDLALEKEVLKLKGLSLKIEGRKKTPLYVGAVTDYYRRILDTGKTDISLSDNLKQIFARPWTKLHFNGKNKEVIDEEFVGHRGLFIGNVEIVSGGILTFKTSSPIERYDGIQIDVETVERPFGFSAEELYVNKKRVFEVKKDQKVSIKLPDNAPFIKKGAKVYLASSTKVKRAYKYQKPKPNEYLNQTGIEVLVCIMKDKVTATCLNQTVSLAGDFSKAKQVEKVYDNVVSSFSKTGEHSFYLKELFLENKEGLFVPISLLNELRRMLYQALVFETKEVLLPQPQSFLKEKEAPNWSLKTDQLHLLKELDLSSFSQVIFKLNEKTIPEEINFLPKDKLVLALPTIIRNQLLWQKKIETFMNAGFNQFMIGNISGLHLLPGSAKIYVDYTIGVLNLQALSYLLEQKAKGVTLSPEDTKENIQSILSKSDFATLIVYQDTELFLSANCVRKNDCSMCDRVYISEEIQQGKDSFLLISENCETRVLKKTPFYIAPEVKDLNPKFYRIDFCARKYTLSEAQKIINASLNFQPLKNTFTGNFKKKFA